MKQLFQLIDKDNDNIGLIETNADSVTIKTMLSDYMAGNEEVGLTDDECEAVNLDSPDADGFVEFLIIKGFQAERIFVNEIYA